MRHTAFTHARLQCAAGSGSALTVAPTPPQVRVRRARWSRSYLAPSHRYGRAEDVYALKVLAEILGGGPTSRLYRHLVVDNKIAIAAGAYYSGDNFGPGQFGFYGRPHPGSDLAALEAAFDAEIAALLRDGVTPAEVAVAVVVAAGGVAPALF